MTQQARGPRVHERSGASELEVIGQLLAAPPAKGELRAEIEALAACCATIWMRTARQSG